MSNEIANRKRMIIASAGALGIIASAAVGWTAIENIIGHDNANVNPDRIEIITDTQGVKMSRLGEKSGVMARTIFADADKVTYSSSNEEVCSVDNRGRIIAQGDGNAMISVQAESSRYGNANTQIAVSVKRTEQVVFLNRKWIGLSAGSTCQLDASTDSGLVITYSSSDENVATVDEEGNILAISPGSATITATQAGDADWQPASASAEVAVTEGTQDRHAALQPFFDSMVAQKDWMKDAIYGGWDGTLEGSKEKGDCITLPSASLIRIGVLPEHSSVHPCKSCAEEFPDRFEYYPGGQTAAELAQSGQLIEGDIVRFDGHTMVFMGYDESGRMLWNSGGHLRMDRPPYGVRILVKMSDFDKKEVTSILRVKTYTISAICEGGMIGGGGQVMAQQDAMVTFSPEPGKVLKAVIVDGRDVGAGPNMSSYTFTGVASDHTIEVRFADA